MNQSALTKKLAKHYHCKSIHAELVGSFLVNDVISIHDTLADINLNQENTFLPVNVAAPARSPAQLLNVPSKSPHNLKCPFNLKVLTDFLFKLE